MNCLLANFMLVARRGEGLGWIEILVFVIVAAVYVLGNFLKSRRSRSEQGEQRQSLPQPRRREPLGRAAPRRPPPAQARRSLVSATEKQYQRRTQRPTRPIRRPQPATPRVALITEQVIPLPEPEPPELATLPSALLLDESTEALGDRDALAQEEAAYLPGILSAYADPEQLRKNGDSAL
ncbi:MAG: hypothetical protein ACYST6_16820 [Planctomycetota bacterium]